MEVIKSDFIDYQYIAQKVRELSQQLLIKKIGFDRYGINSIVNTFKEQGIEFEPVGQGFKTMNNAMGDIDLLVKTNKICHDGHPILRWMMGNISIVTDSTGNMKPDEKILIQKLMGWLPC